MNRFNVGDWVKCVDSGPHENYELTNGRLYEVKGIILDNTIQLYNNEGDLCNYYTYRFKLYQPSLQHVKPEEIMNNQSDTVLAEKYIKEFLKRLKCVLYHDITVASMLDVNVEGDLYLEGDIATIYGVDDIYTYINNSFDQLTSQAAQKRKLELLDKKAKLDLELAEINSELEGL